MSPTAAAPAKSFAGNRSELVKQRPDGAIRLTAAAASIHGPTLVFEPEFGNLGYWHSAGDRASWTFEVDRPTDFSLSIEWACADESAGNPFLIRCGDKTVKSVVGGTGAGSWGNYRSLFLAEIKLPAGRHRLEFRPAGPIRGALLDLRAVVLTPRESGEQEKPTATPKP